MKLPPMSVRAGITTSIASSTASAPNTSHLYLPRSISPGLNCPDTVVYCRRDNSQRWTGMMMAMRTSVMLASAVALPYWGGSNSRTNW